MINFEEALGGTRNFPLRLPAGEIAMQKAAVGFYWTLPVPWAGFTALPDDVEAAAKASRTIRYQREAVRRYAQDHHWALVDEVVFLELQPDRGSAHVAGALRKAEATRRKHAANLLYVDFSRVHGWRGHDPLREALGTLEAEPFPVPADPLPVDGEMFDPSAHFATWRARQQKWTAEKPARQAATLAEGKALRAKGFGYDKIARALNDRGIRSASGKAHTAESVRKALKGKL